MSVPIEEILNLSIKRRLELIEEIWDSIASNPEAVPLTSAQRRELDRRKREHRSDPSAARPWSEVRGPPSKTKEVKARLTPEADLDAQHAIHWYDERNPDLGDDFLRKINDCILRSVRVALRALSNRISLLCSVNITSNNLRDDNPMRM